MDKKPNGAKEILRGVADAQNRFNETNGLNNRLLEIVIANDKNDKDVASKVAQRLANNPAILGVIGHSFSEASFAAIPVYEKAGLAMVSPTSSSTLLSSNVFFRTTSSDKTIAKRLTEYLTNILHLNKVVIFFDSQSIYSTSATENFQTDFAQLNGKVVRTIDLRNSNFDAKTEIEASVNQDQVGAVVLLPSVQTTSRAISVAKENFKLPQEKRLRLFGGATLYNSETLIEGGSALEGMILAAPPFDEDSPYVKKANHRWKGNINWSTAASYDAAQALINSLSHNPTRKEVIEKLKQLDLPPDKTSGYRLRFKNGEINQEYGLVQVRKGGPSPPGSDYSFHPLNNK